MEPPWSGQLGTGERASEQYRPEMQIGVDVSGAFSASPGFEPTVTAAAIGSETTFAEIDSWTTETLRRWGLARKLRELHAKELRTAKVGEVCEMLSERDDVRLAAVVTDSQLLRSPAAIARHRERQLEIAERPMACTVEGARRQQRTLELLSDPRFKGPAYAFGATLPILVVLALQQAFCYFRRAADRDDMAEIELMIDREPARTVEYTSDTLLPTIGGDGRFGLIVPDQWREPPVHPLLHRAAHDDGDGLRPQELLTKIDYVESEDQPCVQVADIVASVVRRRILNPMDETDRTNFDLLQPLLTGEGGRVFEFFTIAPLRNDQTSMYSHLHGSEPAWWLKRLFR
jgi:hypothetical protein